MNFNKNNNFRGGDRGGYKNDRPSESFSAVCAACHKTCEVPFRPNGKKPVYCKECFAKNGGPSVESRGSSDRSSSRRDFSPSAAFNKPAFRAEPRTPNVDIAELKRSLEAINSKLDRLVGLLSEKAEIPAVKAPAKKTSVAKKKVAAKKAK